MLIILSLDDFLKQINYEKLSHAAYALQILQNFEFLTAKDLLRFNIKSEGNRLNVNESIITLALNRLWLDPILKANLTVLAEEINNTNVNKKMVNDENLSRIIQLGPQSASTSFEDNFFNGVSFHNNNEIGFGRLF
ncbi:hypothetical protein RhiirA5_372981 [Rhizophagus irregularis]|uniref:Uncharacterized protein n=3 Tax=Rhizophagus irregularis TaxID=588596 RepID=U9TU19_RHIID|nr:hypothetical protein GLOIN_2v1473005 [Rhizophagus irregularis DAOM 181602=DAOM 197198]EXX64094.1 hypothetical protein RirG_146080 [Rhizophagus irregularis DAOM 197198w]PKC12563.1 hypothetical protein RhiirA5_372981 [Rhizophagus irregularis]PKC75126.1 hypothetical protein RhiirA1_449202 [Rhizophagus irregularis]PKY28601.1 hypothetical protein RhiirB3_444848 [Rhizophagus irregularis]POG78661.1 hypothetical protein GLOIN_2v1473005 [Rhizophagus irregularis DAOM 181602=DAOM 197198]|eukprot:XP_025185527.1 hypothetical protein GLOIN_2v1473005 [Rhizophagus irregularis DAOM 181602=DAOM 197198]